MSQGIYDEDVQEVLNLCISNDAGLDNLHDDLSQILTEQDIEQVLADGRTSSSAVPVNPVVTMATPETSFHHRNAARDLQGADEYGPEGEGINTQGKSLHLVLGDSIAVYLILPVTPGEQVLNLAVRGNTWGKEELLLEQHLVEWRAEIGKRGVTPGRVFIWLLRGNDIYGQTKAKIVEFDMTTKQSKKILHEPRIVQVVRCEGFQ